MSADRKPPLAPGFRAVARDRLRKLRRAAGALIGRATPPGAGGRAPAWRMALAAGCAVAAIAAGLAWHARPKGEPDYEAMLETGPQERRQASLPDGSLLDLRAGAKALVRLYDDRREVDLEAGGIRFSVAPDPERPFLVRAGAGDVRVTGTVFAVRRDADGVLVAVASGEVEVTGGHWWNLGRAVLRAGQGLRVPGSGAILPPVPMDIEAAGAFPVAAAVAPGVSRR